MNQFLNRMERKFGRYAIPGLMRFVCAFYIAGLVIHYMNPLFYLRYLSLDVPSVLHGQVWRLVTFLMQAPDTNLIFFFFVVYLYYMIGQTLETTWGFFRFNVYYFTGVILTILGAFIAYFVTGQSYLMDTYYLNLSMFLAFAFLYPDTRLLLMFLIPIKIKWIAYFDIAYFAYVIITAPDLGTRISALLAITNFIIFYFAFMKDRGFSPHQARRRHDYAKAVRKPQGVSKHRCAVCGRTNDSDPDLEFRFCSKCNGNYEYCQDHLFTHQHIQ